MKTKWLPIAVAVVSALSAQAAVSAEAAGFDYYGYFRANITQGETGSMADSIGAYTFAKTKVGRLGNEFDVYGEVGLGKELQNDGTKSVYIQTMINMWDGDSNSNNADQNMGWENLNMQFRNFMGMGETSWAGVRQYNKGGHYIDMNDLFYWNVTNIGGGIEGMNVGAGKLSVAALHKDTSNTYDSVDGADVTPNDSTDDITTANIDSNQLELTYDSLPVWAGGTLGFGYKFLNADPTAAQIEEFHDTADGHTFLVELNQSLMETGFNRTVLQYYVDGSALAGVRFQTADTLSGDVKSGDGWAIRNYGSIPLSADWELSHAINYAEANDIEMWDEGFTDWSGKEGDASSFSVSAKVTYHWSDITRTYVEAGYFDDEVNTSTDDFSRSGSKTTIAQAWSLGRNQPELRLFASYFDSDNSDWVNTGSTFENGNADDTWAVGLQANVFW